MKLAVSAFVAAIVLVVALAIATDYSSRDSSDARSESRDLAGFTDISLAGDIRLELTQGDEFLVEVAASDGDVGALHTLTDGATLDIHYGSGSGGFFGLFRPSYQVRVTLPELKSVTAAGGAAVYGTNKFTGERLDVMARFGSAINLTVDVASIRVELAGGSHLGLAGVAGSATVLSRGGSELSGGDFVAQDISVDISGGSDTYLTVTNEMTGTASGGSNLAYRGNPETVEVSTSGGAEIIRL